MNCKKCGAELEKNDQFCYNCGFDLSMDQAMGENILNTPQRGGEKPIKSRFSSTSPEKFDSSLKRTANRENQIDNALKNESSNSLTDSQSHANGSKMHDAPKKSNKTASSIFTVLLILFLGGVAGNMWISGHDGTADTLPVVVNQTNYTPEDYMIQNNPENTTQAVQQNTTTQNNIQPTLNVNKDSKCSYCGGNGKIKCHSCGGIGFLTCNACGGDGLLENGESCQSCGGQGRVVCIKCQATGYITCSRCGGTGHK
ncbi:zinc-ribbon domain-containing protein [Methanobacterium alcaliphilum]|uniref:zinc-ribbon domain-containing protein n=1 Tax=Methanobacterium alcaliphilum TaxID=392018 RepID=UPI00200AA404|nr:zinc ribbon domain-containing protein [Methanobacterium alcaliphilum]MCK9150463.1 zinc-ribbon domain-containing protein [Methanobacterium alcaliphilum]